MLNSNLPIDNVFTVYIKIRYDKDNFLMIGNQLGFEFKSHDDFGLLLKDINGRFEEFFGKYDIKDLDIVYIQVSFRLLDRMVFSDLFIDKEVLQDAHVSEKKAILNVVSIPATTDENDLGKPLITVSDSNNYIKQVDIFIKGIKHNFIDIINQKNKYIRKNHIDCITQFDSSCKFYYIKSSSDYILVINNISNNVVEKFKYSLSGVLISRVRDVTHDNLLIRTRGSQTIKLQNNNVVQTNQLIKLKPIEVSKIKKDSWLPDSNIGVIYTETYLNNNNIYEIYALGFKTKLQSDPVIFYIDHTYNSNKIVLDMIDELLRSKYSGITFYCHNLGGYDIIFILKVLYIYNDNNPEDKYNIIPILRDDKIIKVKISKNKNSFTILDSYAMLPDKLIELGKNFEVATLKSLISFSNPRDIYII